MSLQPIYQYFSQPQRRFLTKEMAICYILSVLIQGDSYGSELLQRLEQQSKIYRLSDTVLARAICFLEEESIIASYIQRVVGRGRPRRMLQILPGETQKAKELAQLWQNYLQEQDLKTQPGCSVI
jgi:DNA-binding PadR family transcriptional regulator